RRRLPTTLLLGPTPLDPPDHSALQVRRFQTTAELREQLCGLWPSHDVLFMAAAVADYRPTSPLVTDKIARGPGALRLTLEPTPDLLAELAAHRSPGQLIIGFALEHPDRLLQRAKRKLDAKHLDAIVANPLGTLEADRITATVLVRGGRTLEPPPDLTKAAFADWLVGQLESIREAARSGSERH
ncbi:MAG: phosphopantothenoylcysteine decarboxylase domain-containing protein, partial [Planctomycetota bacterium]